MTTSDRLCPLCDDYLDVEVCPTHRVPTIGPTVPGQQLVRLEVGTLIAGRYRLDSMLGQGGMGLIFQSTQLSTNEVVVLKLLKDESLAQRTYLRRFYQEARAIARLSHPNIVRIIEFGFDSPARAPFLVMERVEGQTLRELVCAEGPLSVERGTRIILQVAKALLEAHDKGVLHRDLKPDNIMVRATKDAGDDVRVLDFGLAKLIEGDGTTPPLTVPGRIVGTPSYMAPEQVVHASQDFRTDLYGLGCVMHAVLVGRAPFFGNDRLEVMRRKVREPPPPLPSKLRSGDAPSETLRALHRALLATNRRDRPESTQDVVSALSSVAEEAARRKRPSGSAFVQPAKTERDTEPRGRIPDLDTLPAAPILEDIDPGARTMLDRTGIDEGLSSEEMVSDAEINTMRAMLALRDDSLSLLDGGIVERANADEPSSVAVSGSPELLPETLPHPVEVRAIRDAIEVHQASSSDEEEAWTSVLPSSLDMDQQDTPTPLMKPSEETTSQHPNAAIASKPLARPRRNRKGRGRGDIPYGFRAGVVLAAISAVTGAVLAVLILRIRPIAPAVDPAAPVKSAHVSAEALGVRSSAESQDARSAVEGSAVTAQPVLLEPAAVDNRGSDQPQVAPPPSGTVSIESIPERADVFDGKTRIGTTPLNLLLPQNGQEKTLRLEKKGYEDASIAVGSSTKERLIVELKSGSPKGKKKPKRGDQTKVPVW